MSKVYDKLFAKLNYWCSRLRQAGEREGLKPYPVIHEMVSDEQMIRLIPYTMMPSRYRHWSFGKQYEQQVKAAKGFHIFEAIINSNPSHCYLCVTNDMLMQILVMAHASEAHCDFFANGELFSETQPESLDARLASHAEYIKRLVESPAWGWERVEYILDAAHALQDYSGWLPTVKAQVTEDAARRELEARLLELTLKVPKLVSEFEKEGLKAEIKEIEAKLKVMPIHPTSDILGFLMDEKNNPRLGNEAAGVLAIVRDESRYFQPQGRTKIMNEGWASYWEKHLLLSPEINLPLTWRLESGRFWTMHDRQATDKYFNPYALGLAVFNYVDAKYGFDEPEKEIELPDGEWRYLTEEEKSDDAKLEELDGVAPGICGGMVFVTNGKTRKVKYTPRNRDKMFAVRRHYEDASFLRTFLTDELFEQLNLESLEWLNRHMMQINRLLAKQGWSDKVIVDPLPPDIEGLMNVVQLWLGTAEESEMLGQQLGTPPFPVPTETLKTMGTILQIVAAFDEDPVKTKQMLILRTGYSQVPVINVVDCGLFTDGTLTLRHEYDENFGPLLQSEAKDTARYVRRLWGRPVRLLTKEIKLDRYGRPVGDPVPYEYYCDEDGEIKERWLQ